MPQVSVLIPTYKPNPKHLCEALDSLLNQHFTDWECLIQDEPTEVETKSSIEHYLKDPRIRYERSETRLGIGPNWNACFKKSSAPIVAYLFQDDWWEPNYLKFAVEVFKENPDVGLISMGHVYAIEGDMTTNNEYTNLETWRNKHLAPGTYHGKEYLKKWIEDGIHPNIIGEPDFVVLRRELMQKVGPFHKSMQQQLDAEYWTRCLLHTNWYYIKEPLGSFRVHIDGTSARNRMEGKGLYDRFTILDQLSKESDPNIRVSAKRVQREQFKKMITKYFKRKEGGEKISQSGSQVVKKFALRHPLITFRAVVSVLITK